jgi:hypothetical protein
MINLLLGIPIVLAGTSSEFAQPSLAQQLSAAPQNQQEVQMVAARRAADYPVVNSATLNPNLNVPWSQPVRVADPFEGSFLAVFDRNDISSRDRGYGGPGKIVSLWKRDSIRVLLVTFEGSCTASRGLGFGLGFGFSHRYSPFYHHRFSGLFPYYEPYDPVCYGVNASRNVRRLLIRAGDHVLELEGKNNVFAVSNEVAAALRNVPVKNTDIRMVLGNDETIDTKIGKGTVAAWKTIYQ